MIKGELVMNDTIAYLLKRYRLNCGYSQQMVANALNIDRSTYTYYETGKSMPSLNTILILKNLFNIPYEELLKCFDSGTALVAERLKDPTADKRQKEELSEKHKRIMLDKSAIYELPKEEQQLVLYYRRLNQHDREELMEKLHNFIKENY